MFQKYPKKREKHFFNFLEVCWWCLLPFVASLHRRVGYSVIVFRWPFISLSHPHSLSLSLSLSHTHTLSPTPIHTCTLSQREADILCLSMVRSENTYLLRKGSITSCLTGLDLTRQVNRLPIEHRAEQLNSNRSNPEISSISLTEKLSIIWLDVHPTISVPTVQALSSMVDRDDQPDRTNCQTNLVIIVHKVSPMFWHFRGTT